jgi:hypothetical protein
MNYQNKPEVHKELFRLLTSYAATRDEAHQHIRARVEALFRGDALQLSQVRNDLIQTIRKGKDTPYAAALVNSAIKRVAKITVGSTAAEDSEEERIEESAMKTMSRVKHLPEFSVDASLLEGFGQLLPANVYPSVAGRTMATGGISRFHKEEGKRYMEFVKVCFCFSPHSTLVILTIYRPISATDQMSMKDTPWPLTTLRERGLEQIVVYMSNRGFCSRTHHSSSKGFRSSCPKMQRANFIEHRLGSFDGGTIMLTTAPLKNSGTAWFISPICICTFRWRWFDRLKT